MDSLRDRFEQMRQTALQQKARDPWDHMRMGTRFPSASAIASKMDDYKYPVPDKPPQKRERCFEVRKVPDSTIHFAFEAIKAVHPSAQAQLSNAKQFHDFESKNDIPKGTLSRDFLLLLFVLEMTVQGLGLTSARTYARGILSAELRAGTAIVGPLLMTRSRSSSF